MNMPGFFSVLLFAPVVVAQWIGVVAIGRGRRGGPWWCMLMGVILATLGMVALPIIQLGIMPRLSSPSQLAYFFLGTGLFSSFGSLLFMVGFAMHALGFRRVCDRISELEMVIEAQNEQLGRQP
ncbi:hypothetical protein [Haloferula sp. A504]|uniref:hypothetical protein n=1 Tax=Haloferula sp. A504 TaxID=3373601 RepID=UPI0031C6B1CA|nr:hypothetical protein [Verrucomicrobiaceae bacterium E54]